MADGAHGDPSPVQDRRKTRNRQAAFTFLSNIQLNPSVVQSNIRSNDNNARGESEKGDDGAGEILKTLDEVGTLEANPEHDLIAEPSYSSPYPSAALEYPKQSSMDSIENATMLAHSGSSKETLLPIERPSSSAPRPRPYVQGRKEAVATMFLSGISLRGGSSVADNDTQSNQQHHSQEYTQRQEQALDLQNGESRHATYTKPGGTGSPSDCTIQRSTSTPSLKSAWDKFPEESIPGGSRTTRATSKKYRKSTTSGTLFSPQSNVDVLESTNASKNPTESGSGSSSQRGSLGVLSKLLSQGKLSESGSGHDYSQSLVPRHSMRRSSSRWLGPLTDHMSIKPLITAGTTHMARKFLRRPSISIPRHITSHSLWSASGRDRAPVSKPKLFSPSLPSATPQMIDSDGCRHIIYSGLALSNSHTSLMENLSQHTFMFTTKHGSPLFISSVLRFNDERVPRKRRKKRFDREYLQQITKDALARKKAVSFEPLLKQSNSLDPEPQDSCLYDPYYLDDPDLKTGKNRTVISLACYMGSVIQYTRPSDLKRELNEHFRSRHPNIDPSITLSKIRRIKSDLLAISEELDLEISTVALAYAYFEKLILKGSWKGKESGATPADSASSPVTKENRRLVACVCLLLAYKVNEPKRAPGEFATLMKTMTKYMEISSKDIKEHEFQVFSLLEFNLYIPRQEFLPHFEQILYRQDYINVQEYLGEDEFYAIAT